MKGFYVDLESNDEHDNTVANFKNKVELLNPLFGEWEVALVEISYTKSWKNLRESCKVEIVNTFDGDIHYHKENLPEYYFPSQMKRKGFVRSGHYENIEQLILEVNTEMQSIVIKNATSPEFVIDPITKYVYLIPGHNGPIGFVPNLTNEMNDIFGIIGDYKRLSNQDLYVGQRAADLDARLHSLNVYCDIIVPQCGGGKRSKLLRDVEIPGDKKFGEQVVIKYATPHYVDVLVNDFDEIEINIKDDSGATIPFMFGRTRLKLHFRPCMTFTQNIIELKPEQVLPAFRV